MTVDVKICGIRDIPTAEAAVEAGAAYIGLNFYPPSPRFITARQAAHIRASLPVEIKVVGLFVDPTDMAMDEVLLTGALDMLQLHGHETPERVAQIGVNYAMPVVKAIPVAASPDVTAAKAYEDIADMLLFDAKPPKNALLPGGNGYVFEWNLLAGRRWSKPWMLSGGLTEHNVVQAIRTTGAKIVDVSSGVEDGPGSKNIEKIQAFIKAARGI